MSLILTLVYSLLFLSLKQKSDSHQSNAQSLVTQAQKLYEAGNYTLAVKILQQAIEVFQANGDQLGQAMAFSNFALVVKQLGQIQAAYSYITKV